MAEDALSHGSFGVGGALIGRNGTVWAGIANAVIWQGSVLDPTAHVERQLVDWFFAVGQPQGLKIEDVVVVTSVDPCAMCTGLLLAAGMTVVAVANDEASGVHGDGNQFRAPLELKARASNSMSFFRVTDLSNRSGTPPAVLSDPVARALYERAKALFDESVENAQTLVGRDDESRPVSYRALAQLRGPMQLLIGETARLVGAWAGDRGAEADVDLALRLAGEGGSVMIDERGVVLLAAVSHEHRSPARSSVIELARSYTKLRRILKLEHEITLPHPRRCTIVQRVPSADPAALLRDLGAVGSLMERARIDLRRPALAFLENPKGIDLTSFAASLPPLYTRSVGVTAGLLSEDEVAHRRR
jgi:tRNA(Arg) A34 adenosine deaminase TadA